MAQVGFKGTLRGVPAASCARDPRFYLPGRPRSCSTAYRALEQAHRPRAGAALRQAAAHALRRQADPRRDRARHDHRPTTPSPPPTARAPAPTASTCTGPRARPQLRDGGADAARGGARPPPADRARAGAAASCPKFRRYSGYTAFVEGWGLYAETPRRRDGLLPGPLRKFGQLTYEMWRAVRLVVDTGMHATKLGRAQQAHRLLHGTTPPRPSTTSSTRSTATSPGRARRWPTRSAS